MRILVACEESQAVTIAFRELGHEAYSCDIIECSGGHPEWHIKGDAVKEAYSGKYDMMIAHPPCHKLSNAGARFLYPTAGNMDMNRFKEGLKAKDFFMKLMNAPIDKICVENPLPSKAYELPKHTQIVQPYEYGHPYSKRTLLWLKNLPKLEPTKVIKEYTPYLPSNTGGKKRGQKATPVSISKKDSSKTFKGIAEAMANQWGITNKL